MTTTVVYAATTDGALTSTDSSYATTRAGAGLSARSDFIITGQIGPANYFGYEGFTDFDTSSLPDADTVSAATLAETVDNDLSAQDFVDEVRVSEWGATLTTADWVAGDSLAALQRVATLASSGVTTGGRYNFTSDAEFPGQINKTGSTRLLQSSDRFRAATTPTQQERVVYKVAETAGTTDDPALTVVHAAAGVSIPVAMHNYRRRRVA